ncbi:unnamed protein product, partial [Prunus brigantina]
MSTTATLDGDGAKNSSGGMSPAKKILSDLGYLWRSGCSFFLKLLKRKMSTEEKRKLGATADEVDIDIDAQ